MGDDSTPIGSHQEVGDDAQRAPGVGDDGHSVDGGAELHQEMVIPLEVVLPDVVAEKAANVETEFAADQQVQHLRYFFYCCLLFTLLFHQVLGSTDGDTAGDFTVD
jgi:hypothetical protein